MPIKQIIVCDSFRTIFANGGVRVVFENFRQRHGHLPKRRAAHPKNKHVFTTPTIKTNQYLSFLVMQMAMLNGHRVDIANSCPLTVTYLKTKIKLTCTDAATGKQYTVNGIAYDEFRITIEEDLRLINGFRKYLKYK